jgi:hypothetical protein
MKPGGRRETAGSGKDLCDLGICPHEKEKLFGRIPCLVAHPSSQQHFLLINLNIGWCCDRKGQFF